MEKIYEYTDYRKYLADYYSEKKEKHSFFSYRYLSNKAGFKTKDFIFRVIRGEKNLSRLSCLKVSKAIGHSKREAEYFENLVGFNQAKTHEEKDFYLQNLRAINEKVKHTLKTEFLTYAQYSLFSEWYHLVIRSIIGIVPFNDDYDRLSKMVYPPITPAKARKSVELLHKLGLIERGDNGSWKISERHISTGEDVKKHAIQNYYLSCMKLAAAAMEEVESDQRNITGLTLGISRESYMTIVARIREFRQDIMELVNHEEKPDRVYKLHFHLFPVSNPDSTNGTEP